ncbi:hypothetical protein JIN77_05325 [Verrucomicrobiaceae bacterium R5-34]|nr:hypothetical protein [Verrucomicrobiaceae bacterium R5-34]
MTQPMLTWSFREILPNEVKQNPHHLQYFTDDALREATDALVREDIQNRLDAHDGSINPVEVRYTFVEDGITFGQKWFAQLASHLSSHEVKEILNQDSPDDAQHVPCLVIEDFNTNGLRGTPSIHRDPPKGQEPRDDFYWFIRNVGRSGKAAGDRGRWGLGKIVYPASSEIRSFFSLSYTADEKPPTLIGRSVLCIHSPDGEKDCASDGFFSNFDDTTGMDMPTHDSVVIEEFKNQFQLSRASEPGLSLIIPFPKKKITPENLILSLIDHWFWVFFDGSLIVRVKSSSREEVVLSKDTFDDVVRQWVPEDSQPAILRKAEFTRDIIEHRKSGEDDLATIDCAPVWPDAETKLSENDQLDMLREKYNGGEMLAFRFNLPVKKHNKQPTETGHFHVYIRRSDSDHKATDTSLREGLAISGVGSIKTPGVSSLLYCDNNPVGTVLGDSENPAHTSWKSMGMNAKYPEGAKIVKLVTSAPQRILGLLTRVDEGLDHNLLENFFSVPDPSHRPKPAATKRGKKKDPPPSPDPQQKNYYLNCHRIKDGFKVTPHEKANQHVAGFTIRAAYEVARGNPFNKHNKADFDFSDAEASGIVYEGKGIAKDGLTASSEKCNALTVRVTDPDDFHLSVTGFDPHRDLILDIKPIKLSDEKVDATTATL